MPRYAALDKNGFDFTIDYGGRTITTWYRGEETITPFNAAFSKAIDCLHTLEDKATRNFKERVYLTAYSRYIANAPVYV